MTASYQRTSPDDALWTLYRQQTLKVRHAFLSLVRREDIEVNADLQMPGIYSREETMGGGKAAYARHNCQAGTDPLFTNIANT